MCDVLLAEPGALIGFAGPRVIATTIKQELPKGFQQAEFLLERGQIDRIVARDRMRDELARLIAYATDKDAVAAYSQPWNGDSEEKPKQESKRSSKRNTKRKRAKKG